MIQKEFAEVGRLIKSARASALKAVNTELIDLYWKIGEYISASIESEQWGLSVVEELAQYLYQSEPRLKGLIVLNGGSKSH